MKGLWDNIHAKRERIKEGSGETMRTPGSSGAPTDKALKKSQRRKGGTMVVAQFNPGCGKVMPGRRKETKYFQ